VVELRGSTHATVNIRHVQPGDRAEWLRLLEGLYAAHPQAEDVATVDAFLTGSAHPSLLPSAVFVYDRLDDRLAGFLELSVRTYAEGCSGQTPYVESWYVDPDERRRGIGRALMDAAERWSRDNGYSELASDAELENLRSHRAHEALGFEEVERTVHYRKTL
jgi:aminoglycoside 6'-N-acetyltransferase I